MASGISFGKGYTSWLSWLPYIFLGLLPLANFYGFAREKDIILLLGFMLFRNWKAARRVLQFYDLHFDFRIAGGILMVFVTYQLARWFIPKQKSKAKSTASGPRPLFIPSRTTHTRLFPKIHSFSYSYLLVGIPVGWQGSVGGMLSADEPSSKSWYSVDAGDYLERGHCRLGLDGKLRKFIHSQGVRPEDYPYAYLITAPKFLSYSFNPVSFWYLYSANKELSAMILEVNNTFDERHMYFLKPSEEPSVELGNSETEDATERDILTRNNGFVIPVIASLPQKPTRFTNSWKKEFHVSPFNSRKGTYSLIAYDPLYPSMSGLGSVNNTITLKSSKAHPKLVARIFSESASVDPETMCTSRKLQFLAVWWWVGLVTFPRIVLEAGKLFFKRKLHVWFRPEPLQNSIGRHADATEQVLEASFRSYVRHLVKASPSPIIVTYKASGIGDALEEEIESETRKKGRDRSGSTALELRILSPVFYTRFVHYADDLDAFFSEFNESGTIWLSQPSLLSKVVYKEPRPATSINGLANYFYFEAIKTLRRRPKLIGDANHSRGAAEQSGVEKSDTRAFRRSAMDEYILTHSTFAEQKSYRRKVLKLLISDHVALGNIDLLDAEVFMLKLLVAWALTGSFSFS